jgi:hypothetical protein
LEKLIPEVLFRNPSSIKMGLGRGLNAPGSGAEANILPTGLKAGDPKCCRHKKTEDVSRTTCTLTRPGNIRNAMTMNTIMRRRFKLLLIMPVWLCPWACVQAPVCEIS